MYSVFFFFRNRDFQEVTLERDGETLLQFAAVYGFRNIQTLVHRMKKGHVPYQLVEVLSCPGGNASTINVKFHPARNVTTIHLGGLLV